jgi:hypothetical protein
LIAHVPLRPYHEDFARELEALNRLLSNLHPIAAVLRLALQTKCNGDKQSWFVQSWIEQERDWPFMYADLRQRYLPPDLQERTLLQLHDFSQGALSMPEYLDKVEALCVQAGVSVNDMQIKTSIFKNVSSMARSIMELQHPETKLATDFTEIRKHLIQAEQHNRGVIKAPGGKPPTLWKPSMSSTSTGLQSTKPKDYSKAKCFNCGEAGHSSIACSKPHDKEAFAKNKKAYWEQRRAKAKKAGESTKFSDSKVVNVNRAGLIHCYEAVSVPKHLKNLTKVAPGYFVSLDIGGKTLRARVDTGADRSILRTSFAQESRLVIEPCVPEVVIRGFDGSKVTPDGEVEVEIAYQSRKVKTRFLLTDWTLLYALQKGQILANSFIPLANLESGNALAIIHKGQI